MVDIAPQETQPLANTPPIEGSQPSPEAVAAYNKEVAAYRDYILTSSQLSWGTASGGLMRS